MASTLRHQPLRLPLKEADPLQGRSTKIFIPLTLIPRSIIRHDKWDDAK
jgi:hypothetical protein